MRILLDIRGAFEKLSRGIARRGLRGIATLSIAELCDITYDFRHRVDTREWKDLDTMSGTAGDVAHAQPYRPTQVVALRKLLKVLNIGPGRTLVDFGCGKGRVLLVAAPFGFRALRGVEFCADLCAVACNNIERYTARSRLATTFDIVHADAADYAVRSDEDVFFLFNPFDDHVLGRVLQNISLSLRTHPRSALLIYRRPVYARFVEQCSPFQPVASYVLWGNDFAVFQAGQP